MTQWALRTDWIDFDTSSYLSSIGPDGEEIIYTRPTLADKTGRIEKHQNWPKHADCGTSATYHVFFKSLKTGLRFQ